MGIFGRFLKKSDFTIYDAIVVLAERIRASSASYALHRQQTDPGMDALGVFKLTLEVEFMLLHLIDRQAFVIIGENKRNDLMDMLVPATFKSTIEACFSVIPSETAFETLLSEAKDNYSSSIMKYANFKQAFPGQDESPEGTLFYEFGKTMSEDLAAIAYVQTYLVGALKDMRVQEFLQALP